MKPYANGLIVGRFQIFHIGHERIVRTALRLSETVLILIGSSQESRTEKNPLSYEERRAMISAVFGREIERGKLIIAPLPDIGVGNVPEWGRYVLENAAGILGVYPDLLVSGKEERRVTWFDGLEENITELYVPKTVDISATKMRELLRSGELMMWKIYSPLKIHPFAEDIARALKESEGNGITASV